MTFSQHVEAHFLTVLVTLAMLVLIGRVLSKQRRPGATMAWILAIVLVPYVGIPLYVLFGGRKLRMVRERKRTLHEEVGGHRVRLMEFDHPAEDVLTSEGVRPPSRNNRLEFVDDGVTAYRNLCDAINAAERSIYVQTYVLHRDTVGRTLVDLLAKKAAQGLDVRLLLDSYGSMRITDGFLRPLIDAGGHVARFLPMVPVRRNWSLNLRNHRKVFIVDGRRATIGGRNLGLVYMGPEADPARWIDSEVQIEGPGVADLLEVFCSDWNFASRVPLDPACAQPAAPPPADGVDVVQIAASGPDVQGDPLYEAVLASIHAARQRIWMVTPYFSPGDELFRALLIQARIGRDVRLLMPARSNHLMADLVRGPYLRQLAEAGGKVLLYEGRMIHSKNMVFDERTAITGTMNFDLRSLYLNFEVALFAYETKRVQEIAAWMETLMHAAVPLTAATPKRARLFVEQLSFLLSPLL